MEEVTPAPVSARVTPFALAAVALALAFAGLAALVVGGSLTSIDRHALLHWMPWLDPSKPHGVLPSVEGLFVPFSLGTTWWEKLLGVATYPASVLISIALFGAGYTVLVRRGERVAARIWFAAWFVANALEVAAKVAIEKPALHREKDGISYHVRSFDHSFPSGHTVRAVLVAAVIGFVWTRFAWPAAIWALLVPLFLVVESAHVLSDVAGGLVLGLLVVLVTYAVLGSSRLRGR
jgi:membrane-associated phospholipid phosphatase